MPGGPHRDPEEPAAHVRNCLALLPSGPDAVRRLRLHRVRAAVRPARNSECTLPPGTRQAGYFTTMSTGEELEAGPPGTP